MDWFIATLCVVVGLFVGYFWGVLSSRKGAQGVAIGIVATVLAFIGLS